ncbi:Aste57867_17115 [Aphanomyces stellatus]|uniref:Aste57867_17115 protein n=1 Tax=Aphanomyces stellatus TaxID=120398 RepID=A0A485L7S9_9STRA|nr:hypothetical protein As57867_017056 [Aphanomyces stellatus]VFT93873.1 Aste57867_17115 [Aphanomyces stellatus]
MAMRAAIYLVGLLFAGITLWAITLPTSSSLSSFQHVFTGAKSRQRTIEEKRAMALAFVQTQLQANSLIPGLSFSVVYQNETVIATGFGTKQFGNPNSPLTGHSVLQIGSFTKTFTALGIGKLVDDGLVKWSDTVKQHLPWFRLMDKYAEQYTTLADLLAMNSVFGNHEGDMMFFLGAAPTEKVLVERLAFFNTTRPLRAGYAYSNLNFAILGQVIEHVTHQPWFAFIKTTFFDPLGMNETFGRPSDVTNMDELSSGHCSCDNRIHGPYSIASSTVGTAPLDDYSAEGSILTSANDLAKFSHFLLNRGRGILKSPKIIQEMTTGHTILPNAVDGIDFKGDTFHPDGSVQGIGYGIGTVGNVMYGYDFYDKNGGTLAMHHHNGFVPSQGLGVTLGVNVHMESGVDNALLERMRTYVLGIFLDVPQSTLDATWDEAMAQFHPPQGLECDPHFIDGQPSGEPIPLETQTLLVGTYMASESPRYNGNLTVFKQGQDLMLHYGVFTKPLLGDKQDPTMLVWTVDLGISTASFFLTDLNTSKQALTYPGLATFVRVA